MNARFAGVDPRLYFITDTALCAAAGRAVPAVVADVVAGGAGVVQVRDKTMDDTDFYDLSRAVIAAVARAVRGTSRRVPVVINDRVAVAHRLLDEGYDVHVHVGQDDLPAAAVRADVGTTPLLGVSAATVEEIAAAERANADYIGIGPAFATSTKPDAGDTLGVARVTQLARATGLPAFAIGGINAARARALRDSGIAGVCVISAICSAPDPRAAAAAILAAFGNAHD